MSESRDALTTKSDIADVSTKAYLREFELRLDARFELFERRMTIRWGAMLIAAVALIVTIQGFNFALVLGA